jgi:hypothetical protein
MVAPGQIPGRYNIIIQDAYDTFEHQIPVEDFIQRLKDDEVPEDVSVVGLSTALADDDTAAELAQEMDRRADDLEYQNPTVQFIVQGTFHRSGKTYDLRYKDELYPLDEVFGSQLDRKEDGEWIVAPF